jgi:hypothetical protein
MAVLTEREGFVRVVLAVVIAGLTASPLSISAQEGVPSEPSQEESAASSQPAPEEPVLQLKLDAAGVKVTPTPEGFYIVEPESTERELRPEFRVKPVEPARIGLLSSTIVLTLGGITLGLAFISDEQLGGAALAWGSAFLTSAGLLGMLVSGAVMGARKRKLRRLQEELYGTPRRFHWDLTRSRLVF